MINIPNNATRYGFVNKGLGSHASRTMMLSELRLLLAACPPSSDLASYRSAIVEENVLLKQTGATRVKSHRHLRQLYGLNPNLLIFRSLRDLWEQEPQAQPLLALLCAVARDPSLKVTSGSILDTPPGSLVASPMLAEAAKEQFPGLNTSTLDVIGRDAASTWTQSGHLRGHRGKIRVLAKSYPTSAAYALFLGHLCGERGAALFHTLWVKLLDAPVHTLREQAILASQQGWLEYRYAGDITDISFRYLMRADTEHPEEKI